MCDAGHKGGYTRKLSTFQKYFRALHCPTRWVILQVIGEGAKSTNEIFEGLIKAGEGLSRSGLYYHLSELEEGGIIEFAGYREEGGGAPEKVWRLKTRIICIDLLEDLVEVSDHDE